VIICRNIRGKNLSVYVQSDVASKTTWDCQNICNDNNNNIYSTAIGLEPGGRGL